MITATQRRTLATRILSCVLLVAFVLQSAAQAGQGCIARAFSGSCCCVEASVAEAGVPSCCAHAAPEALETEGPVVSDVGGCHCEAIALPLAATALPKPVDATSEAGQRVAAQTIALAPAAWCAEVRASAVDPIPRLRPPDRERLVPRAFAGSRDNAGRLSRLRVCLR